MSHDIGRDACQVLPRREAVAVIGFAYLFAVLNDASGFTIENDAVLSDGDLINSGGFGE